MAEEVKLKKVSPGFEESLFGLPRSQGQLQAVPTSTLALPCQVCPSPARSSSPDHEDLHQASRFSCAACGESFMEFEAVENHIVVEHVGDDPELVRASILLPIPLQQLKLFQVSVSWISLLYFLTLNSSVWSEDMWQGAGRGD